MITDTGARHRATRGVPLIIGAWFVGPPTTRYAVHEILNEPCALARDERQAERMQRLRGFDLLDDLECLCDRTAHDRRTAHGSAERPC